jgi:hypothetical protein
MTLKKSKYYLILNGFIVGENESLAKLVDQFNNAIKTGLETKIDLSGLSGIDEDFQPIVYQTIYAAIQKAGYKQMFITINNAINNILIQKR